MPLPPGCVVDGPICRQRLSRLGDEREIILKLGAIGYSGEEALDLWQAFGADVSFEVLQVVRVSATFTQLKFSSLPPFSRESHSVQRCRSRCLRQL
jgi:hypothetical protein